MRLSGSQRAVRELEKQLKDKSGQVSELESELAKKNKIIESLQVDLFFCLGWMHVYIYTTYFIFPLSL